MKKLKKEREKKSLLILKQAVQYVSTTDKLEVPFFWSFRFVFHRIMTVLVIVVDLLLCTQLKLSSVFVMCTNPL